MIKHHKNAHLMPAKCKTSNALRRIFTCLILLVGAALADSSQTDNLPFFNQLLTNAEDSFGLISNRNIVSETPLTLGARRGQLATYRCQIKTQSIDFIRERINDLPFFVPDRSVKVQGIERAELVSQFSLRPVVYIHGFNESVSKGCQRAYWLKQQVGIVAPFYLWSWPANGNILTYASDETDLYWSVSSMVRSIKQLAARSPDGEIDLIAHSLGVRGALLTIERLAADLPQRYINNLILVAGDIDSDRAGQIWQSAASSYGKATVYNSKKDQALLLSRQLHGYPRLGLSSLASLDGLNTDIIDTTAVDTRFPGGHHYHLTTPLIQREIQAVLAGKGAEQRDKLRAVSSDAQYSKHWILTD